jgi:hypothetical protein
MTRVIVFGIISPLFGILMGYIRWRGLKRNCGDIVKAQE